MEFHCTCTYCGKVWMYKIPSWSMTVNKDDIKCPTCNDKNIKIKKWELANTDVFGYLSDEPKKDAYIKGDD